MTSSAQNALLEGIHLEAGYGKTRVLNGLSFRLDRGQRIGFFGPNGHGKSTLLKVISGLMRPWNGSLLAEGRRIDHLSPRRIVEQGIIHVAQGSVLFPHMTVLENLWLSGQSRRSRPLWRRNFDRVMSTFPQLASRRKQLCQTLSGGERQMLAIGMGLMGEPKILMLDEPTLGLAPRTKENLCAAIQKIAVDGTPLVTVDQDLEFLITLSSHLYFVNHGTVSSEFDATSRLHHAELIKMYFGRT